MIDNMVVIVMLLVGGALGVFTYSIWDRPRYDKEDK